MQDGFNRSVPTFWQPNFMICGAGQEPFVAFGHGQVANSDESKDWPFAASFNA